MNTDFNEFYGHRVKYSEVLNTFWIGKRFGIWVRETNPAETTTKHKIYRQGGGDPDDRKAIMEMEREYIERRGGTADFNTNTNRWRW